MADDPVLLITGASTGIGAATARQAAEAGFRLVLSARSEDKLSALAEELGGDERAIAVRCDVTEWSDQEALVRRALDTFGASTSPSPTPASAAHAGSRRARPRSGSRWC
jgi:NADP-dependent 3-hydroxy acid dehydrogenase YdfG